MEILNKYTGMISDMKSDPLPDKPSGLLRLAVKDLELVENDPDYRVEMEGLWHERDDRGKCWVCFAGAVMAKSIHCPKSYFSPCDFPENVGRKLKALDHFRVGNIIGALYGLGKYSPTISIKSFSPSDYEEDPDQFKADMLTLADYLEKEGL